MKKKCHPWNYVWVTGLWSWSEHNWWVTVVRSKDFYSNSFRPACLLLFGCVCNGGTEVGWAKKEEEVEEEEEEEEKKEEEE